MNIEKYKQELENPHLSDISGYLLMIDNLISEAKSETEKEFLLNALGSDEHLRHLYGNLIYGGIPPISVIPQNRRVNNLDFYKLAFACIDSIISENRNISEADELNLRNGLSKTIEKDVRDFPENEFLKSYLMRYENILKYGKKALL
ncbi:hypothetical protein FACS189499_07670 [Clostridia bacterium]|nr:hypothetical protein FACS189499_07670 [Clostridia bacterium]